MFSCEYVDGKRMLFHQGNSIRFPEMFYIHFRKQDNYYELRYPGINSPYRKFSKGEDLFKNYLKLVEEITENESIYDIGLKTFLLARQYELDGVIEVNDLIIINTTNHLDKIDPAYLRPGRTDLMLEVPKLTHKDILVACERLYPKYVHDVIGDLLEPISGANLMDAYVTTYPDPIAFMSELKTRERR